MRILLITSLSIYLFLSSCQPARSDVYQEIVNPGLVKNLLSAADSVIEIDVKRLSPANPLIWVRGQDLYFTPKMQKTTLFYDELGNISGMLNYEKGILKDSIIFYPNGQRMFTLIFDKNGIATGPARYYHPDGRVKEDGRFEKGIKTGIWRTFREDGRLLETHEYDRYGNRLR